MTIRWRVSINMGNICCTDTSTEGVSNGKHKAIERDDPLLQGNSVDHVELPHISEREIGM